MDPRDEYRTLDPATGELIEAFPLHGPVEVETSLARAEEAFHDFSTRPFAERAQPMRRAAELLRERAREHAATMALEMGKPLAQGEAESKKCALVCDYYADEAERLLGEESVETDAAKSFVRFDALGVVFAVMPWNFPFWQVFRFAAPALMAGNAVVLKHAPNVPRCARAIAALARDAGFPEGLFSSLFVDRETAGNILGDARIRAVTLTGSDRAGSEVGARAGRELKKCVLELGGSDAFVVLGDADVERAATVGAEARLLNSGQSCIAAKRFIVVERVFDRFLDLFVAAMRKKKIGDPRAEGTEIGPLARFDLRDALHRQVVESERRGAKILAGGSVPEGPGAFYPPTVLSAVEKGMPAFDEETFGPVAAVVRATDEEHAITLANDSSYGLGASVWTRDTTRAIRLAERFDVGCVFVNGLVKSDPRIPFGGVKRSGFGRELGAFGIREFVNVKSVWIA